jgi:putative PIN family toxin of toxin-antitoxin system
MRVTVDSNIVLSAFFWGGNPRRVLNAARSGAIRIFTSPALLAELADVLSRTRFEQRLIEVSSSVDQILDEYQALATIVDAPDTKPIVLRDPDDDAVVACAIASESDVIVSGDRDLLDIQTHLGIRILSASELLNEIGLS